MTKFQHFQKYQAWYETAIVSVYILLNNTINATSMIMEESRNSDTLPFLIWQPFLFEYSSAIGWVLMLPAISWLLDKSPLMSEKFTRTFFIYLSASVVFSLCHITIMVWLRKLVYWTQNLTYEFGDLFFELIYEYRKDLWSFLFFIMAILSYRFIFSRLQGEANSINLGEDKPVSNNIDRLLVKKLGKEFIIKVEDIEWFESSGNYVNLHIQGRVYPMRTTMNNLIQQIENKGFCRIHRCYGINMDAVTSITPLSSGDSEIKLNNGKLLNLSRRYKEDFKLQLDKI
jgi:hypothetical protein